MNVEFAEFCEISKKKVRYKAARGYELKSKENQTT